MPRKSRRRHSASKNGRVNRRDFGEDPNDDEDPGHVAVSFCENSSIRGVSKLAKHSRFSLRVLWIFFLISMTVLLAYGSIVLIVEYLSYHTLINTRENHQETAAFPSLTYCNHHPFSSSARSLWGRKEDGVTSPRDFSAMIRGMMKTAIKARKFNQARDLFLNDKMTSYFETLGPQIATRLSHTKKALLYCLLQLKNSVLVGHAEDCGIEPTNFLHPKYINCQTIRVKESLSRDVVALGLIVNLDGDPDYFNYEMGLIQDVFNQAHGTRVTLHEPGTYPDPVRNGINIEAGKYTEMKFETVKWNKVNSRRQTCLDAETMDDMRPYQVNGMAYNYTSDICQQNRYAHTVYRKCNCYSTLYPLDDRERAAQARYCSEIDPQQPNNTYNRLSCFGSLNMSEMYEDNDSKPVNDDSFGDEGRKKTSGSNGRGGGKSKGSSSCDKRCSYYTYAVHSSTSRWIPTDWQLFWLMNLTDAWGNLLDQSSGRPISEIDPIKYEASMKAINDFLEIENLTHVKSNTMKPDRNVFFVVTRSSFITTEKVETLSLTASALLSRIGGLSSLSLGVTFATIFELVEFLCLCRRKKRWRESPPEVIYLNSHTSAEPV